MALPPPLARLFEDRKTRARTWVAIGLLAAWAIGISGILGNNGLLQAWQLAQVRRDIGLRVRALENERQRLKGTLASLEQDPFVQETAVRETLGFVRANDLVFEFR